MDLFSVVQISERHSASISISSTTWQEAQAYPSTVGTADKWIPTFAGVVRGDLTRHQNRQLHIGMAGKLERHLLVAQEAVLRMAEGALAALAAEHAVLVPHLREFGAEAAQLVDQGAQPADEKPPGRRVPAPRVPIAVEDIGRGPDRVDCGKHRRRHLVALAVGRAGIALAGVLEQIGPLGAAEPQRVRQPRQRRGRYRNVAALLDPAVPGGAEAGELGDFLAPEARRAAAAGADQTDRSGRQLLALRPDEIAKLAPPRIQHGAEHTRIISHLKRVSAMRYNHRMPPPGHPQLTATGADTSVSARCRQECWSPPANGRRPARECRAPARNALEPR